jgi:hypothetical protein
LRPINKSSGQIVVPVLAISPCGLNAPYALNMANARRRLASRSTFATRPHFHAANSRRAPLLTTLAGAPHHLADLRLMTDTLSRADPPASTLPNNKVLWPALLLPIFALPQPAQSCSLAWPSVVSAWVALVRPLPLAATTGAAPPTAGNDQSPGRNPPPHRPKKAIRNTRSTLHFTPDSTPTPRPSRSSS